MTLSVTPLASITVNRRKPRSVGGKNKVRLSVVATGAIDQDRERLGSAGDLDRDLVEPVSDRDVELCATGWEEDAHRPLARGCDPLRLEPPQRHGGSVAVVAKARALGGAEAMQSPCRCAQNA